MMLRACLDVVDDDGSTVGLRVGDADLGDGDEAPVGRDCERGDRARVLRAHQDLLLALVDVVRDQRRPGRVDDRLVVGVGQRARETRHARAEYVARRRQRDGHGRGALDYTSLPLSLYND